MTPITETTARIEFALRTIAVTPPLRVSNSIAQPMVPPGVVIGPPRTTMARAYNSKGPIAAQWLVYLISPVNEYAMEWLGSVLDPVIAAIERWSPGVVMGSTPGMFPSPTGMLPAHILTVASPLSGLHSYHS